MSKSLHSKFINWIRLQNIVKARKKPLPKGFFAPLVPPQLWTCVAHWSPTFSFLAFRSPPCKNITYASHCGMSVSYFPLSGHLLSTWTPYWEKRAFTVNFYEYIQTITSMLFVNVGDCNIPGNATLVYDINFVGIYSGNRKWRGWITSIWETLQMIELVPCENSLAMLIEVENGNLDIIVTLSFLYT